MSSTSTPPSRRWHRRQTSPHRRRPQPRLASPRPSWRCGGGYRSPDLDKGGDFAEADSHPAREGAAQGDDPVDGPAPAARPHHRRQAARDQPGARHQGRPLETAIDELAWSRRAGVRARPKVVGLDRHRAPGGGPDPSPYDRDLAVLPQRSSTSRTASSPSSRRCPMPCRPAATWACAPITLSLRSPSTWGDGLVVATCRCGGCRCRAAARGPSRGLTSPARLLRWSKAVTTGPVVSTWRTPL